MRKMDEMEMTISLSAIKLAWVYTVVFLFIWIAYDFIIKGSFNENPAFFLLITQNMIFIGNQLYLKRKMIKNEK
ncbi:MAG: hypothetical protein ACTIJA_06565 [Bavariicoccus seileri]|uniref:hypothetical protein n=1 Tax=Bavariicoccus seileri TaxID=549685 RepID=UPI003F977EE5